ncbi:OmpH family outer membrane protein [Desulforhabdus amnigena]|jgi:outer membrane protein|uniref:OmpH family outer membrane protein n=1 Tax=Desulforhabdus amnigena TaxID=40218 RepID=A0A9W6L8Q0_9BACT|nr:OmpH family outer membrane protein [Desulforhabdus amnigena]NLJ26786.1 OmpH family outer membrane protein [Deltaproteobacteria bacterium]GLI35953.1 hypothetical protein DAMNIGENAA_33860 [Desulforhabdus amnigena]
MKKRISGWWILLVLGIFVVSSSTVWAASSPKIGYFELPTVLQQSRWGKQSNEEFKREGDSIKADVDRKVQAFKTAKEEFDKKKDVLDEKTKAKKIKELQALQQEGEKLLMESNAKMSKLSNELTGPLVDKVLEIVRRIGKEEKYDYIFEREKAGIVFADDKENLTRRVIDELDKVAPHK